MFFSLVSVVCKNPQIIYYDCYLLTGYRHAADGTSTKWFYQPVFVANSTFTLYEIGRVLVLKMCAYVILPFGSKADTVSMVAKVRPRRVALHPIQPDLLTAGSFNTDPLSSGWCCPQLSFHFHSMPLGEDHLTLII